MAKRIFVDADSCARPAKSFILRTAEHHRIAVFFVANRAVPAKTENPLFVMHVCGSTKDAADNFIVEKSEENDIAVTRDLILAQRLLEKNTAVLNDKGVVFTKENMQDFLNERELSLQMKALGVATGESWHSYGKKDISAFSKSLSALLGI